MTRALQAQGLPAGFLPDIGELLILAATRRADHGYGITTRLREAGVHVPQVSISYPILARLESKGFVRGRWRTSLGKRMKRVYLITPSGGKHLSYLADGYRFLVGVAEALGGGSSRPRRRRAAKAASEGALRDGSLSAIFELLVLAATRRPIHGFGIMRRLQEAGVRIDHVSSLYPVLFRLADAGLVRRALPKSKGRTKRRIYRMTARGGRRLARAVQRYRFLLGVGETI